MEASALKNAGAVPHGGSPLMRLQSDERLVALIRRGNQSAFEALVSRYQSRLLSFCRHMLGSKEDAEDVLQEVFTAAYNAMLADERAINARPWLYRIARNRCLNHMRRAQAIGVDSMDIHVSEAGATTADKVHSREEFRLLMADVSELPETQRTALLLREIDALSYDQISEVMDTTVPSVKSLLVRARVSLAEAAEARQLSCEEVRLELGEAAEGLKRLSPPVRRHVRTCERCRGFKAQLKQTNRQLQALLPIGPLIILKKFMIGHLATSGAGAAGSAATGSVASGVFSAGISTVATKAAAGIAAAAIVTVGTAEVKQVAERPTTPSHPAQVAVAQPPAKAEAKPEAKPIEPQTVDVAQVVTQIVTTTTAAAQSEAQPAVTETAAVPETTPEATPLPAATPTVEETQQTIALPNDQPASEETASNESTTPTVTPPGETTTDETATSTPPAPQAGEETPTATTPVFVPTPETTATPTVTTAQPKPLKH